jgi:hypothetical protein
MLALWASTRPGNNPKPLATPAVRTNAPTTFAHHIRSLGVWVYFVVRSLYIAVRWLSYGLIAIAVLWMAARSTAKFYGVEAPYTELATMWISERA